MTVLYLGYLRRQTRIEVAHRRQRDLQHRADRCRSAELDLAARRAGVNVEAERRAHHLEHREHLAGLQGGLDLRDVAGVVDERDVAEPAQHAPIRIAALAIGQHDRQRVLVRVAARSDRDVMTIAEQLLPPRDRGRARSQERQQREVRFGMTGLVTSVGGLFAVDICPKRVAGAALGMVGVFSYLGAGIQDQVSGKLLDAHVTMINGVPHHDFTTAIWFWIGASVVSLVLASTLWRTKLRD